MRIFLFLFFAFSSTIPVMAKASVKVSGLLPKQSKHEGWNIEGKVGIDSPNFHFNRAVPATPNGLKFNLGGKLNLDVNLLAGDHEWRNGLSLAIAYKFSELSTDFTKGSDKLTLSSMYYYTWGEWWGGFGHFLMDTPVFPYVDVQPEATQYIITDLNDVEVLPRKPRTKKLALSGYFSPMELTETLGVFFRPIKLENLLWEIRLGAFFLEGLSGGQLFIEGEDETPPGSGQFVIRVGTLPGFFATGASVGTQIGGIIGESFSYLLDVEARYAFYDTNLVGVDQGFKGHVNFKTAAELRYQILKWLGVSWKGSAKYLPYVTSDVQFDTMINLDFSYSI